jgi:hypothetical protein
MLPAMHVASHACCQPRMLLATHATCSRPRAAGNALLNPRGVLVEPARLEAPCRLQHTGQGGQCLMSTGRRRHWPWPRRMHAPGKRAHADLAREAACCSTAHLALVARLDDLRHLHHLHLLSALHLLHMCCAVRTPRLFCGRARGFPQRRARRGAQGAIPSSG